MKPQPRTGDGVQIRIEDFLVLQILGAEMHPPIRRGREGGNGITIDRGIQHRAAETVAIRTEVGSPASQAQTQRRARADGGGDAGLGVDGHAGSESRFDQNRLRTVRGAVCRLMMNRQQTLIQTYSEFDSPVSGIKAYPASPMPRSDMIER